MLHVVYVPTRSLLSSNFTEKRLRLCLVPFNLLCVCVGCKHTVYYLISQCCCESHLFMRRWQADWDYNLIQTWDVRQRGGSVPARSLQGHVLRHVRKENRAGECWDRQPWPSGSLTDCSTDKVSSDHATVCRPTCTILWAGCHFTNSPRSQLYLPRY